MTVEVVTDVLSAPHPPVPAVNTAPIPNLIPRPGFWARLWKQVQS